MRGVPSFRRSAAGIGHHSVFMGKDTARMIA
jgi:hypothetical protein